MRLQLLDHGSGPEFGYDLYLELMVPKLPAEGHLQSIISFLPPKQQASAEAPALARLDLFVDWRGAVGEANASATGLHGGSDAAQCVGVLENEAWHVAKVSVRFQETKSSQVHVHIAKTHRPPPKADVEAETETEPESATKRGPNSFGAGYSPAPMFGGGFASAPPTKFGGGFSFAPPAGGFFSAPPPKFGGGGFSFAPKSSKPKSTGFNFGPPKSGLKSTNQMAGAATALSLKAKSDKPKFDKMKSSKGAVDEDDAAALCDVAPMYKSVRATLGFQVHILAGLPQVGNGICGGLSSLRLTD